MPLGNRTTIPLMLVLVLACSDSTGIAPEDLAGTWAATSFVFTSPTNAAQSVDWMQLGATLTLTISAEGTFTTTLREPDGTLDTDTGTVSVSGTVLTIAETGQGSPTSFTAVRDGDTLTLTDTDEEYDFDDDGTDDPATLRITLSR